MPSLDYLDFVLEIEPERAPTYRVQVLESPAGQASYSMVWPYGAADLNKLLTTLSPGTGSTPGALNDEARQFGQHLFALVFREEVLSCLRSSRLAAERQQVGLRLRLALGNAPELALWPWELLCDPIRNQFLLLSRETPLIRHLPVPYAFQPLAVRPPLRVLVMSVAPVDLPSLAIEREWQVLLDAVAGLEQGKLITLERVEASTLSGLQRALRSSEYHIFHFVGHGAFDPATQTGSLLFADEQGQSQLVSGSDLGTVLHDHRSLRLAVLNSCEGAQGAAQNPFAGVAQALLQQRVPSVLAMQWPITERAAQILAGEFYTMLAQGAAVDTAVAHARRAIFAAGHPVEWAAPVHFLRAPDGVLFDLRWEVEQPVVGADAEGTTLHRAPTTRSPYNRLIKRRAVGVGVTILVTLFLVGAIWRLWYWPGLAPIDSADEGKRGAASITLLSGGEAPAPTTGATPPPPTPAPLRVGVAALAGCPPALHGEQIFEQLQRENPQAVFTTLAQLHSVDEAFAQPNLELVLWGACDGSNAATYLSAAVLFGRGQGAEREIAEPEVISVTWPVTDTMFTWAVLTGLIHYYEGRYDTAAAKLSSLESKWSSFADDRQRVQLFWLLGNAWLRHSEGRQGSMTPYLRARDSYRHAIDLLTDSAQTDPVVLSWLLNNLGWAHSYLRERETAERYFAQAAEREGYVWPQIGLCSTRLRGLQYDQARIACDEAILQAGDFVAGYYWRARLNLDYCTSQRVREGKAATLTCWDMVIQDAEKARRLIEQQRQVSPQLVTRYLYYLHYVEGLAYCYREEPDKALTVLEQGLALGPSQDDARRIREMIAGVEETQCR